MLLCCSDFSEQPIISASHVVCKVFSWLSLILAWQAAAPLMQNAVNRSETSLLLFLGHPVFCSPRALCRTIFFSFLFFSSFPNKHSPDFFSSSAACFKCAVYAPCSFKKKEKEGCSINSLFVEERSEEEEEEKERQHRRRREGWIGDSAGGEKAQPCALKSVTPARVDGMRNKRNDIHHLYETVRLSGLRSNLFPDIFHLYFFFSPSAASALKKINNNNNNNATCSLVYSCAWPALPAIFSALEV